MAEQQQGPQQAQQRGGFDMSKYHQRYVAFKLAYIGWHYDGLAVQNTNAADNSIEVLLPP